MTANIHLVLFLTRGMSLSKWVDNGSFEREVALYRALLPKLGGITFVTYGGREDLGIAERIPGIGIVCNRWGVPMRLYKLLITRILPRFWKGNIVVKSNQTAGAETALEASKNCGGKFVSRCGYLLSDFCERRYGFQSTSAASARELEKRVFSSADLVVVTTEAMRRSVIDYGISRERVSIVPNYVDTVVFSPAFKSDTSSGGGKVVFVGRLETQKNPIAMVEAMGGLDTELVVVGRGSLETEMREKAKEVGAKVSFLGNVRNESIPEIFSDASAFLLPSFYEGHPKSLLEAMSSGLAVIAGDSPGINSVIKHGETGYLCGTDASEIRGGIKAVLENPELRRRLGANARLYIEQEVGLDRIVEKELELYENISSQE